MTVKSLTFFFFLLITTGLSGQHSSSSRLPNIILILADDLGYGELGCYGQKAIETPHIDALASTGIRFTQFYTAAPVCAPARCMLLTGLHSGHAYIRGNDEFGERGPVWDFAKAVEDPNLEGQRPLPDSTFTMGDLLQTKGYTTAVIGKWGLGGPLTEGIPGKLGFDFFFGYNCQRQAHTYYPRHLWKNEEKVWLDNKLVPPNTRLPDGADTLAEESYADFELAQYAPELMLTEAQQFIRKNKEHPFFLYYATPIPHVPLQAPRRWVDYYRKKLGPEAPYTGDKGYFPCRYPRATYAAMISYLDEQVGALVEQLKAEGLYENTLILFTSDNGPTYAGGADTPFFESGGPFGCDYGRGKGFVHEGGIRVPLIAAWPGHVPAGKSTDLLAALWDLLPTFSELTEGEISSTTDGLSLLPTFLGQAEKQLQHEFLYWEFPEYKGQQAVRMGHWKAIRKDMQEGNLSIELYNLETDLGEQTDVAAQHPEIVARTAEIMRQEHSTSAFSRFYLKALGEE
ncbi:MAG: arylsulfatase [Lewinellaceae bacterium]|nr:arylsulfatase [Lewinellaceae bacterium]